MTLTDSILAGVMLYTQKVYQTNKGAPVDPHCIAFSWNLQYVIPDELDYICCDLPPPDIKGSFIHLAWWVLFISNMFYSKRANY